MVTSEKMPKRLTRRGFIKAAGVGSGALAFAGLGAKSVQAAVPIPDKWDMEADVVIAGFGGAGACAAIEAARQGASVLLLDKAQVPGGSTRLSGGIVYAAGTKLQKQAGIDDTPEAMFKYVMACGQGRAVPELVRVAAERSAGNVAWLEGLGAVFPAELLAMSGMEGEPEYAAVTPPTKRGHRVKGTGSALFEVLNNAVKAEKNIKVVMATTVTRPITRPATANGRCEILGLKALRGRREISIRANRAVVLSTGGIMSGTESLPWLKDYSPDVALCVPAGALSSTGDGYRVGIYCGAALKGLNTAGYLPSVLFPGDRMAGIVYVNIWGLPNIYVTSEGNRFCDESAYYVLVSEQMIAKKATTAYCIFDTETVKKASALVPKGIEITRTIALGLDVANLEQEVQAGRLWKGNSIAELARNMGIDASRLEQTISAYNANAAQGKDPAFNRKKALSELKTAPYYGLKINVGFVCHDGGLSINPKAQVLDTYNEVIPRLYAAGRDSIGIFGGRYIGSGGALCDFLTFGRLAGMNAALEKPWSQDSRRFDGG
jgi:fumarate reductase flavoprotein subunit